MGMGATDNIQNDIVNREHAYMCDTKTNTKMR
jgi:hypothetical protein